MRLLQAAAALAAVAAQASAAPSQRVAVRCQSPQAETCIEVAWSAERWIARASFVPSQNETGWATLFVETPKGAGEQAAAFAAGYVEGLLTAEMIGATWANFAGSGQVPSDDAATFVRRQLAFVRQQVQQAPQEAGEEASYWHSAGLVLQQLSGLAAGYAKAAQTRGLEPLTEEQIMLPGMWVELLDIKNVVEPRSRPHYPSMTDGDFFTYLRQTTHCSALFRVTPDLQDLFSAHTAWAPYTTMLRIVKLYKLPFSTSKAEAVLFSGYPGALASIDDFFVSSQKLVVIETTNNIFNNSLYDLVVPETVPYWIRVTVATRAATTSKEWHDVFYRYNSGTYNNQWMVADYKLLVPGQPLQPWTFSVSEQLPGKYFHGAEDMTMVLQRGHWASYNVPFFSDVYEVSGYPEIVKQRGVEASYQLAPRAPIFRRDAEKVNSLAEMQRFMRENNYGTGDPLAKTACHAIACRADLLLENAKADGALDAKIVDRAMVDALALLAISGPTTQKQPPFQFVGRWSQTPHRGMPETFNFEWQTFTSEALRGDEATADAANIIA